MTMSEVDRTVLAGNAAIERSRERRRPIGTKSLALRRQHLFRKIGRMFMAGGAVLIAAALFGMLIQPLGFAGVMAVTLRSEEHTSELQSLMRISYAVFCLKKKSMTKKTNKY